MSLPEPVLAIRRERPDDAETVFRVIQAAFGDRSAADFELAFVAEEEDEIVGHTMLSYVAVEDTLVRSRHVQGQPRAVARCALSPRAASAQGASGASPWTGPNRTASLCAYDPAIRGRVVYPSFFPGPPGA